MVELVFLILNLLIYNSDFDQSTEMFSHHEEAIYSLVISYLQSNESNETVLYEALLLVENLAVGVDCDKWLELGITDVIIEVSWLP